MRRRLPAAALISLAVLLVEHCTTVTLTRYTQQRTDVPPPSSTVAVALTEVLKLLLALALETTHAGGLGSSKTWVETRHAACASLPELARMAVPALLYTVQNNLIYVALGNLEMVTFQLLYQSKLLLTGGFSVCILGMRLHWTQWLALVLLACGVTSVELSNSGKAEVNVGEALPTRIGTLSALAAAGLSSLAGVYFEMVVKSRQSTASLWLRNIQMCVSTIPLAMLGAASQREAIAANGGLLVGFDYAAVILVALNASGGLLVAAVIKYGDNVLKNFSSACSVVLGTLLSIALFHFKPTLKFFYGALLVAVATVLYSSEFFRAGARETSVDGSDACAEAALEKAEQQSLLSGDGVEEKV